MARITDEVIWEILLKLPPESILRCRTVCKSWLKMIQNPLFIKAQVEKTARINTIDNRLILVPGSNRDTLYNVVFPSPENLNVASVKKLEHPGGKKRVNLVGTCNGLICLENKVHGFKIGHPSNTWYSTLKNKNKKNTRYFTLWNPSTRVHRIVPDKSNISLGKSYRFGINTYCYFGYDHVKDDYHVIRVTRRSVNTFITIHFYSLKNDSWTKIHNRNEWAINVENGVCISGTLYLLSKHHKKIIAFDISTLSFRLVVELPAFMNDFGLGYIMGELHGRLSIMEEGPLIHLRRKHVIWLMMNDDDRRGTKETCLWKRIEIEASEPISTEKLLPVAAENQLLFVLGRTELYDNVMTWCDLKTKSTTHILLQCPLLWNLVGREACVCLSTIATPFIV